MLYMLLVLLLLLGVVDLLLEGVHGVLRLGLDLGLLLQVHLKLHILQPRHEGLRQEGVGYMLLGGHLGDV